MWHFQQQKKYFYGHKCMVYIVFSLSLSLSHICNSATSHPIIISFATWKKRSVLCSIFFLSSWHYDPHYYYIYYYSMNAIVFFSTAILLYFFKLKYYYYTILLHTLYNYLYLFNQIISTYTFIKV